jgi:hypothetical protein
MAEQGDHGGQEEGEHNEHGGTTLGTLERERRYHDEHSRAGRARWHHHEPMPFLYPIINIILATLEFDSRLPGAVAGSPAPRPAACRTSARHCLALSLLLPPRARAVPDLVEHRR